MNKIITIIVFLMVLSINSCLTSNKEPTKTLDSVLSISSEPSNPFYNGDGGKSISIAILEPKISGLAENQKYLPPLVQGEFVSNFTRYSAISVLDRLRLDDQYAELLSGYYDDNVDPGMDLGHLIPTDYIMIGSVTKTSFGYVLQITITKTSDKMTIASYSGTCTFLELDNLTGIRRASLDLLQQMGVESTSRTQAELTEAAGINHVNAQTALAQGIVAQHNGTIVEALSYYYEATSFDPSIIEAANRATSISTAITSGNIRENVLTSIQLRNEWLKVLREATAFFMAHPPYEIVYDPLLNEGMIDYEKVTIDLYFNAGVRVQESGFKILSDLAQGLKSTGRSGEWGLAGWPDTGEAAIFTSGILNYKINAILTNNNGETIGHTSGDFNGGNLSFSNDYRSLIFRNVNVNDITDNLKVSIISVNGIDAAAAGDRGYISIIPNSISHTEIFDITVKNGTVEISGYKGNSRDVIIPSVINDMNVTSIGSHSFDCEISSWDGKRRNLKNIKLNSVIIPNGITSIGSWAFSENQLTSITVGNDVKEIGPYAFDRNQLEIVVIPNSVVSIGSGAFYNNKLTRIVIPNSVTSIGYEAFRENPITSITIPANVILVKNNSSGVAYSGSFANGFDEYYNTNGEKAGTYTCREEKIAWRTNYIWNYSP